MSLFGKKKDKEKNMDSSLPDLPDLPEFPGASEKSLNFPKFESKMSEDKFMPPQEHKLDNFPKLEPLQMPNTIPRREKHMPRIKPVNTFIKPRPMQQEFKPPEIHHEEDFIRPRMNQSKPIYIQIEKFQEAANSIDKIKEKIKQADDIIEEISRLRAEEDKELELWHADLNNIKERLLNIDKALFGDN